MPTLEQACLGCRPRAGLPRVQLLTPLFNLFKPQFPLCKMWPAVSRLWTPGSLLGAAKAGSVECAWQPHACPWVPHTSSIYPTEAGDVRKPDPAAPHAGARAEGPPLWAAAQGLSEEAPRGCPRLEGCREWAGLGGGSWGSCWKPTLRETNKQKDRDKEAETERQRQRRKEFQLTPKQEVTEWV